MKRLLPLILCLALVPCLPAQDPAPVAAAATDPAQLELARAVIKSMHADRMMDQMGAQMQKMAAQAMNMNAGNLTPAQKEAASKVQGKIMDLSMDAAKGMIDKMDVIYAEVYSTAELKAMRAFFESPEGMSMLQKQPQIMQKLMPYMTDMQKDLMPKIQKIVEEAKANEAKLEEAPPAATAAPAAKP